jgi:hypothetical protein
LLSWELQEFPRDSRQLPQNSLHPAAGNFLVPIREFPFGNRDRPTASGASKTFLQPGLLEDRIGGVPGLNAAIDREVLIAHRAVPDFMVALALAVKPAPVFLQYLRSDRG